MSEALATPGTAILQEADSKLLFDLARPNLDFAKLTDITDPDLIAVIDLMKMREGIDQITRANLEGQRPRFAKRPELYRFLDGAFAFYAEKDLNRTLVALSPTTPPTLNYLAFSEAVLRGQALEAKGDSDGARKLWLDLLAKAHQPLQPAVAELAVARNYERAGQTDLLFAKAAPQTSSEIRQTLLSTVAGAPLLRQVARTGVSTEERTAAIRTLLYEDLFQRKFADFGTDVALIPSDVPSAAPADPLGYAIFRLNVPSETLALFRWTGNSASSDYSCPSLSETAGVLAHNEQSSKGLICLGEFILHNRLDGYDPARAASDGDLGSGASQFSGEHYSRLTGYMQVMADTKAPQGDQAYALYRAIRCFAPTGSNSCGLQDIEKDQRKAWFHELKTKFKDTKWANELRYYW